MPPKRHKRRRDRCVHHPCRPSDRGPPNHVWALDYQFDVTTAGHTIKILHVTDEFTRESLADVVAFSIDADATVAALDTIVSQRGSRPDFIRCETVPSSPPMPSRTGAGSPGPEPATSSQDRRGRTPGSSPYGSRMRDELLAIEHSTPSSRLRLLVTDWRRGSTTHTDRTLPSACSPLRSSPIVGDKTNLSSRNGRADQRGPVSPEAPGSQEVRGFKSHRLYTIAFTPSPPLVPTAIGLLRS